MSKIPADQNGAKRPTHLQGLFSTNYNMSLKSKDLHEISDRSTINSDKPPDISISGESRKEQGVHKTFVSLIPKKSFHFEKTVQSSRIINLREKLNEMSRKQDNSVDKKTKGIINDITQRYVDDKHEDESGPYSLLFDLHNDQSSSSKDVGDKNGYRKFEIDQVKASDAPNLKNIVNFISKNNEKHPNVINFDEKSLREFEYSCESEGSFMIKKTFSNHQSRSDLCLQLNTHSRNMEFNSSPNDNSLHRANEENSLDDSLGILTPDQMDDICYLENTFSPTVEGLPTFSSPNESKISPGNGDTPSTDKTESNSAASTIQNDGFEHSSHKEDLTKETHEGLDTNISALFVDEMVITSSPSHEAPENEISNRMRDDFLPLIEEDFMPSINSSILEPISSVTEKTVNLEIPLDCKNKSFVDVNRIEQTPSPEDLPLDSSDVNCVSTCSQFSVSTMQDTDSKIDNTKSMETSKVSNSFITSITSITSDGYQGDGEMSRPVSRGGDHSIGLREEVMEMDWQNVPVTRRADPMTDSDFFTESDADGFDEHMQRGDRRAQVIDGALYRGKNGKANPALIVNNRNNDDSCMESSGVFTDFENHRSSPVFLNVINDLSPEATTPSTRSECSQNNGKSSGFFTPGNDTSVEMVETPKNDDAETPKTASKRNSLNSEKDSRNNDKNVKEEKRFTLKKYKMPKRDVPSKLKTMLSSKKEDLSLQNSPKAVKKTERRDCLSKKNTIDVKSEYKAKTYKDIKSKVDCSFSLQRSQTACSVTRLLSSKSTSANNKPKSRHMRIRMDLGSANGSGKSSLHSSQSDISAPSALIVKQTSGRFPLLPPLTAASDGPPSGNRRFATGNGKKRESTPVAATPARAPTTPPQPLATVKKNGVVQKLSASPVTVRTRTSLAPPPSPRKPAAAVKNAPQRPNTLPANKEPPRVSPAVGPRSKRAQTPQPARTTPAALATPHPAPPQQAAALAHAAKGVEALGVLVQYLVFRLDALNGGSWRVEAEKWRGVAAAERTSAARADRDRQQRAQKDLDTIAECLSKISELEIEVSSKEEANARLQAAHVEEVAALASDIKGLKDTIESLKHEVAESRARLHAHSEIERTLRAQLEAARAEIDQQRLLDKSDDGSDDQSYKRSLSVSDAACDPVHCEVEDCELRISSNEELSTDANELAAEVRSLRAVIELKQAEMASLRDARSELNIEREMRAAAERDVRSARHAAEELRERAAARQKDVDRLRDENRRLRDVAARDRDHAARLAAVNEELRYKLKQKSQVVSLLAGGGYIERSPMRARSCSNDSNRSGSPAPDSPPSPASPAPAPLTPTLPAVKGVVEKHDSVSWVLEIEETPEEVASRLARKSSFRNTASPSGVKRRGGGSPGSGSPAPASPAPNASKLFRPGELDFSPQPPPLKESAGEAIYIYDDRQY